MIETDYAVIGAGAMGMAFADVLPLSELKNLKRITLHCWTTGAIFKVLPDWQPLRV
jgi:hypothetical protein